MADASNRNSFAGSRSLVLSFVGKPDQDSDNKYNPFKLYKWAIILFNIAFMYEVVIVVGFWTIILPGILLVEQPHSSSVPLSFIIVAGGMDHSLPLVVLLIDFSINCVPIIWRHFFISFAVGLVYMLMNMIYSVDVKPVYPVLTWQGPLGVILPILIMAVTFGIHLLTQKCNKFKLKKYKKASALSQLDMIMYNIKEKKIAK